MKLEAGDRVFIYTKLHLSDANNIEIKTQGDRIQLFCRTVAFDK